MHCQNMNVAPSQEWMPNGPNATPIYLAILGILARCLQKRKKPSLWQALNEHFETNEEN